MQRFQQFRQRLAMARAEEDIGVAMRDLLDTVMPSESADLPETARAALTSDQQEIPAAAVDLKRSELLFAGTEETRAFLHQLSLVYEEASQRLGQMQARRVKP
jgi:hypothetical protein